jgi:hypothetical protein
VDHGYNYVLLMGADFWRLSASAGISYLASRITAAQVAPRTVLATGISPTARLRFQGRKLALRALYFRTRASGPLSDVLPEEAESGLDERFRWRLDTLRLGVTWTPFETIEVSADQIVSLGKYHDAYTMGPVDVSLMELVSNAEVAISFGRYVTVRGTARLYVKRYDQSQPSSVEDTVNERRFGGALEFVF